MFLSQKVAEMVMLPQEVCGLQEDLVTGPCSTRSCRTEKP